MTRGLRIGGHFKGSLYVRPDGPRLGRGSSGSREFELAVGVVGGWEPCRLPLVGRAKSHAVPGSQGPVG